MHALGMRSLALLACLVAVAVAQAAACSETEEFAPATASCPDDMVYVPYTGYCIDRWESSLDGQGRAVSAPGVLPATEVRWAEAEAACEAAGKTLCPRDVWAAACSAGGTREYPYGDEYEPDACNARPEGELMRTGELSSCEGGLPGLFDMLGNVWEWELEREGDPSSPAGALCWLRSGSYAYGADPSITCEYRWLAEAECEAIGGSGIRCCGRAE
jgi:formylglycine-generating enzyme required for sulfatase activity